MGVMAGGGGRGGGGTSDGGRAPKRKGGSGSYFRGIARRGKGQRQRQFCEQRWLLARRCGAMMAAACGLLDRTWWRGAADWSTMARAGGETTMVVCWSLNEMRIEWERTRMRGKLRAN